MCPMFGVLKKMTDNFYLGMRLERVVIFPKNTAIIFPSDDHERRRSSCHMFCNLFGKPNTVKNTLLRTLNNLESR